MSNKAKKTRQEGLKEMKDLMTKRHPLNPKNVAKDATLAGAAVTAATTAMKAKSPKVKATAGASAAKIVGKKLVSDVKYVGDWINAARKILFNHPEWYSKYGALNSANLQWNLRKQAMATDDIAAGLTITYTPTIPMKEARVSRAYIDSINMIYAKLRSSNSGAYNYDTTELADYIEAARSIYAVSANIARDIALLNNVDILSANSPDVIMMIAGMTRADIDDIRVNRANYIDRLNRLNLTIANLIPLPPQLSYIERSIYMAQLALKDGDTDKAVPILTRMESAYQVDSSTNYSLQYRSLSSNIGDRLNDLEAMITNFNGYKDGKFSKIAGDMLKAYGEDAFMKYSQLTNTDKVNLTFDPYLLTQLQNCNTASLNIVFDQFNGDSVHAVDEAYMATLRVSGKTSDSGTDYCFVNDIPGCLNMTAGEESLLMVNNYKNDCSAAEVISLTRLCAFLDFSTSQHNVNTDITGSVYSCGTEFVNKMSYVYYDHKNGLKTMDVSIGAPTTTNSIANEMLLHSLWSQVDYSPILFLAYEDPTVQAQNKILRFWNKLLDLNVTAQLSVHQLANFTETATLSLLKTVDIDEQINFIATKGR